MAKKQKHDKSSKSKPNKYDPPSDAELASSEDGEAFKVKRNPRNVDDAKNKLNLDEFHRVIRKKDQKRNVPIKKKIRDIERFLSQKSLPEDLKKKKEEELRQTKREAK